MRNRMWVAAACLAWCSIAGASTAVEPPAAMFLCTDALAAKLDDPGLVLIHVGHGRGSYEKGHIPGARFVEPRDWFVERDGVPVELPDLEVLTQHVRALGIDPRIAGQKIVLYDDASGMFASRVYFTLAYLGLAERTALLDGQLRKWVEESRPTTSDEPATWVPSDWTPQPDTSVLATFDDVWAAVRSTDPGRPVLIDARPRSQFAGERRSYGADASGHIPGAVNVPALAQIESVRRPVLIAPDAMASLYAEAGVTADQARPIIVYDAAGMHASQSFVVLRRLGFSVRLYDGSLADWIQRGGAMVQSPASGGERPGAR